MILGSRIFLRHLECQLSKYSGCIWIMAENSKISIRLLFDRLEAKVVGYKASEVFADLWIFSCLYFIYWGLALVVASCIHEIFSQGCNSTVMAFNIVQGRIDRDKQILARREREKVHAVFFPLSRFQLLAAHSVHIEPSVDLCSQSCVLLIYPTMPVIKPVGIRENKTCRN